MPVGSRKVRAGETLTQKERDRETERDWRYGSEVKSTYCSGRGFEFSS